MGDGDVQSMLEEAFERTDPLKAQGVDLDFIANKAAEIINIDPSLIWTKAKEPEIVKVRSSFCYWAAHELPCFSGCN